MQLFEEGRGDEQATEGNNCGLGCGAVRVCFGKGLQKKRCTVHCHHSNFGKQFI